MLNESEDTLPHWKEPTGGTFTISFVFVERRQLLVEDFVYFASSYPESEDS